ncbi:MAG: polysaccharide pyruvyl transferase family protein [Alphaproteobacteria bacterium]|nr:polysaccharide pyruvyl transferase family protein [Alphaproteobacteria bacterium]
MDLFQFLKVKESIKYNPMKLDDTLLLSELESLGAFAYIPNSGNMGDMLIAAATIRWFNQNHLNWGRFNQSEKNIKYFVYGGGGAWTHDWIEGLQPIMNLMQKAERVVILPSSFRDVPEFIKILDKRFTVFCREKESFEYLKSQNTRAKILLDHDMAFRLSGSIKTNMLAPTKDLKKASSKLRQIVKSLPKDVRLFRKDSESEGHYQTDLDLSNEMGWFSPWEPIENIEFATNMMFELLNHFDVIRTDRLHIAIASALLGKQVIIHDNIYGKLKGVHAQTMSTLGNVNILNDSAEKNDKIVKFLDCYVPVKTCNFKCHYCYITQNKWWGEKLPEFKYSPEYIARALSKKRLGGVSLINLCGGGETLLPPEITDIARCLLQEGHYVMIVTNTTVSKRFDEILALDKELLKRLFFKCSFQYLELKRTNLMEQFFSNIRKIKESPASFTVELTVVDELIPHIPDIKEVCMKELGALCHLTIARDETKPGIPRLSDYSCEEARKIWGDFKSPMFDFKLPLFEKKRTEFCYAGHWSYCVNLGTGDVAQCYGCGKIQNIFEDLTTPLESHPIGCHCPNPHCWNNHAFLSFGDIVGFDAPTFAQIRDRVCLDGTHWLKPEFQDIFSQRLDENNPHFSKREIGKIEKGNKSSLKYYKYKILSKITFGKKRNKYKSKLKKWS